MVLQKIESYSGSVSQPCLVFMAGRKHDGQYAKNIPARVNHLRLGGFFQVSNHISTFGSIWHIDAHFLPGY